MAKSVFRKSLIIGIIILFVGAGFFPSFSGITGNLNIVKTRYLTTNTNECTFRVNNDYDPSTPDYGVYNFSNITDAIAAASKGDKICVHNGTYNEDVMITQQLIIEGIDEDYGWGNDENGSIVSGEAFSFLIISASGTIITNFTIKNAEASGIIILLSHYVEISCNRIQSENIGVFGISVTSSIITKNNIFQNRQGILLQDSKDCDITWNHIENNKHGIELVSCNNCFIYKNHIEVRLWDIWIEKTIGIRNVIRANNFITSNPSLFMSRFDDSDDDWDSNYWSDWHGIIPFYIILGWIDWFAFELDRTPQKDMHEIPYYC